MLREANDVLTLDELSAYLRVSKSTLYKLVQSGALPGQKVGKQWRFRKDAVDEWLVRNPRQGKDNKKEDERGR